MTPEKMIEELNTIGSIKFGEFKLKSGITSPIYIDLRPIVSYPRLLQAVADMIWDKAQATHTDLLCGVPYTALPFATHLSIKHNKPMLMVRKEAKDHGTKKMVEGHFKPGQTCLLIEDVVTSGSSVLETIEKLSAEGIKVTHVAALVDRQQGGREAIEKAGCQFSSVFTLDAISCKTPPA